MIYGWRQKVKLNHISWREYFWWFSDLFHDLCARSSKLILELGLLWEFSARNSFKFMSMIFHIWLLDLLSRHDRFMEWLSINFKVFRDHEFLIFCCWVNNSSCLLQKPIEACYIIWYVLYVQIHLISLSWSSVFAFIRKERLS